MTPRTSTGSTGLVCTRYWVTMDPTDLAPTMLTPDFLRYNEIVPVHWNLERPVFVSPDFTEMVFDSGLTVQVEYGEVEFAVAVDDWPGSGVGICNQVVRYFLSILPGLDLTGFSVGIEGYAFIPDGCPGIVNIGTPLEGQLPVVSYSSRFFFPDRRLTFEVREVSRGGSQYINCLDFRLLSSCSVDLFPDEFLSNILVDSLEEWEDLFKEFVQLSTGFYSRHIEAG